MLVGGEGTRLRPLTSTVPKAMLPIAEVPMIERIVGHLGAYGVDRAVLSLGYRPAAFLAAYPDGVCVGVAVDYAVEPEPLDTAGAVAFAARHANLRDTFLVVNGDVLTDLDVGALVADHRRSGAEATIHLVPVEDPSAFGVVPTDGAGRVTAFVEKPPPGEAPTNLINAGTYVLEPSVLERIPPGRHSIERETFPALVADGRLHALASDVYWLDTGTPAKYLRAHADLLSGRRHGPPAPGAQRVGLAWVLGRPDIAGAVGGSLVADGATVAAGASVEGSALGARVAVGPGAEVRNSVLLAGARVGEGAVVEGSVVGPDAVIEEGGKVLEATVLGAGARVGRGEVRRGARVPGQGGSA